MKKYRLLQGNFYIHCFDGTFKRYSKGDIVEVDDSNELMRFKNKFEKVDEAQENDIENDIENDMENDENKKKSRRRQM